MRLKDRPLVMYHELLINIQCLKNVAVIQLLKVTSTGSSRLSCLKMQFISEYPIIVHKRYLDTIVFFRGIHIKFAIVKSVLFKNRVLQTWTMLCECLGI